MQAFFQRKSIGVFALALAAAIATQSRASAATFPQADGPARCAPATEQREMWEDLAEGDICHVVAFGPVPATTPTLFYQLQSYRAAAVTPGREDGEEGQGVVLLTASPHSGRLLILAGWRGSGAAVAAPRLVRTSQGPIVVLEMSATVSSHPTDDVVFRPLGGQWTRLSPDWDRMVKLPKGTEQRHGNAMDWASLRAFGAFWRPSDTECCPTGGSYIAQLRLTGAHLSLSRIRYSRGALPFP